MSKHHHQSKQEQINNRIHDAVRFEQDNTPYQEIKLSKSKDILKEAVLDDRSIRSLANEIYHEKGGSTLDNWLEAERILKNNDLAFSRFKHIKTK